MPMNSHWKEELDRILRSSQGRDPTELIEEIHELGAAMEPAEGEALLYANPHFLEHRPALQEARYEMVVRNEIAQSRQFLEQARDSPASFPEMANSFSVSIYSRTGDIFEHLNFGDCRRMILVGCGWMPVTLFHVHDKTNVPELVGLDIVPDAVATANELAKRLGYARIRAELQDGRSYDFGGAQIVYIVGMAFAKSAILSRIADTAPDDVQVLVNEPYSLGHLWHEAVEPSLDPRFEIIAKGPGRATRRDLFLRRRAVSPSRAGRGGRPNA